eukprot:gene14704-19762_t
MNPNNFILDPVGISYSIPTSHTSNSANMMPNNGKNIDLAEKKRRRLERNRESARECRRRKKEKKIILRQQLAHLEADNLQLRLKLQVGHETSTLEEKSSYITSSLDSMIKEGASESDIQKAIEELQERFSDYGRDRRSAIDFHVSQLRRCLKPTQTTRAILWLLSCAPKFHNQNGELKSEENKELSELWFSLLDTLKPTPEQQRQLISFTSPTDPLHDPFKEVKLVTDNCNKMLDRLVDIICNKNDSLDNEMANLQTILSARQIAKFILWIDQNPACMQMLEALWPHLTHTNQSASDFPKHDSNLSHLNMSTPSRTTSTDNLRDGSDEDYSSSEAD